MVCFRVSLGLVLWLCTTGFSGLYACAGFVVGVIWLLPFEFAVLGWLIFWF